MSRQWEWWSFNDFRQNFSCKGLLHNPTGLVCIAVHSLFRVMPLVWVYVQFVLLFLCFLLLHWKSVLRNEQRRSLKRMITSGFRLPALFILAVFIFAMGWDYAVVEMVTVTGLLSIPHTMHERMWGSSGISLSLLLRSVMRGTLPRKPSYAFMTWCLGTETNLPRWIT